MGLAERRADLSNSLRAQKDLGLGCRENPLVEGYRPDESWSAELVQKLWLSLFFTEYDAFACVAVDLLCSKSQTVLTFFSWGHGQRVCPGRSIVWSETET